VPCTARMISIMRRQSTNLCRAFLILCKWSCANPHALVRMIMIATPRTMIQSLSGISGETRLWLTITRNGRPRNKTGHQAGCHSHAADSCSQLSKFRANGESARAVRKGYHNSLAMCTKRARLDRGLKPTSLLRHEILTDVRVGSWTEELAASISRRQHLGKRTLQRPSGLMQCNKFRRQMGLGNYDDLVGKRKQLRWKIEAERFGGEFEHRL
jgi:hypothetical protein